MYGGNLGLAIITVSVITRLALLPLTVRIARHAQAQQRILFTLRDEIAALRKRYKSNPKQFAAELSKLYQGHGVKPVNGGNLAGGAVQVLVGAGLYSAIQRGLTQGGRFLWIRNLSQPDAILVLATGVMTLATSLISPHLPEQSRIATAVLPAVMTVVLAWRLSSAVVLYWASSAAVNGLQGLILRSRSN
jgi:YidC/Oxa1 family membrane protein insertase